MNSGSVKYCPMTQVDYYILIGDSESGPWTLGQLKAFWRAGAVTLETLYAQPDASEWKPLAAIPDFTSTSQSKTSYADEQREMIETAVNVMLPADATKLRQWLRDKLTAIGFAPETDAIHESFRDYLAHFSGTEQEQAFGKETLYAYRRGDNTPAQLIGKADNLIALQQFRASSPLLDYDAEKFKEARRMAGESAVQKPLELPSRPTLDAFTAEVMRKAVERRALNNAREAEFKAKRREEAKRSGEVATQSILDQRARRIREQLGLPEAAHE
jgi:hypothetical protein